MAKEKIRHKCDWCGKIKYPVKTTHYWGGLEFHFCSHACFMGWWQIENLWRADTIAI